MRLAIFDIDGTLLSTSSERLFWLYLWRHKCLHLRQLAAFAAFLLRHFPAAGRDVARKNKAYLSGLALDEVGRLAQDFVGTAVWPRLRAPVVERLRTHQRQGDTVLLLSGTLQMIADALADRLGVAHVIATVCSESGGRFVAKPPGRHPFGAAKLALAREFARQHGLDLGHAAAYCDSHHDLPLLEAVGFPVAVRPDCRLRDIVRARDWQVLHAGGDMGSIREIES